MKENNINIKKSKISNDIKEAINYVVNNNLTNQSIDKFVSNKAYVDMFINQLSEQISLFINNQLITDVYKNINNAIDNQLFNLIKPLVQNETRLLFSDFSNIFIQDVVKKLMNEVKSDVFSIMDKSADMIQLLSEKLQTLNYKYNELHTVCEELKLRLSMLEKQNSKSNKRIIKRYLS